MEVLELQMGKHNVMTSTANPDVIKKMKNNPRFGPAYSSLMNKFKKHHLSPNKLPPYNPALANNSIQQNMKNFNIK